MTSRFASDVAMVRPAAFRFNVDTATSNHFQVSSTVSVSAIQEQALKEFDSMVQQLRENGLSVLMLNDNATLQLPDAIFPNNWFISFPGEIMLCPMAAPSRRQERRTDFVEKIMAYTGAVNLTDWSKYEEEEQFLEGTGSLIFDHQNKKVYACRSIRTNDFLFNKLCVHKGYQGFLFGAHDRLGRPVYHTNVMMCLGNGFAIVCEEAITDVEERKSLRDQLMRSKHEIIAISFFQMEHFAGNMLQLQNKEGKYILVMSSTAHSTLTAGQLSRIESYTQILRVEANIIETTGGGSVRCMMAELFPL